MPESSSKSGRSRKSTGKSARNSERQSARKSARKSSKKSTGKPDALPEAAAIGLLVLDCDGVLTDGRLLYGPGGEVLQRFSVYDGYGIELLRAAGVEVAILTGKTSAALMHRAQTLGIRKIVQGCPEKASAIARLAEQAGVDLKGVAFVGDDLFDLGAIRKVGFSAAPANARAEVKAEVSYVCDASGGEGAVREVAEILLRARGVWPPPVVTGAASDVTCDAAPDAAPDAAEAGPADGH